MIGGGQLARMTHQAAIALGQTLRVLAASPDDPAAQVSPDVVLGSHTDLDALRRVAAGAAAVTFDHEHVPGALLDALVAAGVNVAPPPEALIHAQDKLVMRRKLEALGAPVPRFAEVTQPADVDAFAARIDGPIVVKAARGGYDGRGVTLARDLAEARAVTERYLADGAAVLLEERVDLRRELAALVARSPFGQGASWPIVQTVQRDGICVEVIAPAPGLDSELAGEAERLGLSLANELGVVGVLAVELFEMVRRDRDYDPERWLDRYTAFMLAAGKHRDTYVEEYHRDFFTNLAAGRKPINCGVKDVHIGGLVAVPALVAAFGPRHPDLRRIVRLHVRLTHKDDEVLDAADTLTKMLIHVCQGEDLRTAILDHANGWISAAKVRDWDRHPDDVVVGRVLSPACYIPDAFPAALFLARRGGRP